MMVHQHPKMEDPIRLVKNHDNPLYHILFIAIVVFGIAAFLFGLYSFVIYQQGTRNKLREEAVQNTMYDSISSDFAHFTYKESSSSAEVMSRYYVVQELENISKEGTFSATLKAIISKTMTHDVHLEWPKNKKDTKYAIFTRDLRNPSYFVTSLTTPENFVVLPLPKYKDMVVKIRACDAKNCADSKELYIPQEQTPQFALSAVELDGRAILSWDAQRDTIKYNVFKRNSASEFYKKAAMHTKETEASIGLNEILDSYFMVQACNTRMCWSSNEVVIE